MRHGSALCAGLGLMLAGCAQPSLLLMPNDDGLSTGAVAVLDDKGGETVVDRPLTQTRLAGRPSTRAVKKLDRSHLRLLGGLPPRSIAFILYFKEGTTTITPGSLGVLDEIRAEIASRPGAEVQVTGHTDTVDSTEVNDRLSERRASEIVEFLVGQGFSPDLLSAVGRGERELFVETGDNVPNQQNRRVEVIVR